MMQAPRTAERARHAAEPTEADWAHELARMPELRAALEEEDFAQRTMGAFLKDALRQIELESRADNVVPFKPKTE